jgi:pimeloyl-ACP methyl ester carboxylesterase
MQCVELQLDVSDALRKAQGTYFLAASAYLPPGPAVETAAPVAMFAIPGGGYSRGYFDMHFAGHADYSQAAHHVERGLVFIAVDPLGVGTSSLVGLEAITFADLAASYDSAVRQLIARTRTGTLLPGFPAVPRLAAIGIGQSMGGCVTILTQARYRTFAAIAPLGYSAIHTQLPQRTEADRSSTAAGFVYQPGTSVDTSTIAKTSATVTDYVYPFHWEDVPQDILTADMGGGYPMRKVNPPFGSATIPPCAVTMMYPGAVKEEAASIDAPVLIAAGERDVCPHPHTEPSAYRTSRDVGLFIVPRMAHMHNFAGTRRLLWERLVHWSYTIGRERAGG